MKRSEELKVRGPVPAAAEDILEGLTDGVLVFDAAWRFTYLNPVGEKVLGRPRSRLLGCVLWEEFPELEGTPFGLAYRRTMAERMEASVEGYYPPFAAWFEARSMPRSDGGLTLLFRDVTRQVEVKKAAEEQKALLALIIEQSSEGIIMADAHGGLRVFNPAAQRIHGVTQHEVASPDWNRAYSLFALDGRPLRLEETPLFRAVRGELVEDARWKVKRPDGQVRTLAGTATPLKHPDGSNAGGVLVTRDETQRLAQDEERLWTLAALRESEARFRHLADSIPHLLWTSTPEGAVDYLNARWYAYSGQTPGRIDHDAVRDTIHPLDIDHVLRSWGQAFAKGHAWEGELRIRGADGQYRWFLTRITPMRADDGRITQWLGSSTDIDEQRRARETQRFLAEAGAQLSESSDYEATLKSVARLAVPVLADWCVVDLVQEGGHVRRVEVVHADPAKEALGRQLHERYPAPPDAPYGAPHVLRTGASEFVADIPDTLLEKSARSPEHLRLLRELNLRSYMVVPLKVKERVLGAITFVSAESCRRYSQDDLQAAEELARRAALALENARLFHEVRRLNQSLEQRVQERTAELQEANRELESFSYSVSHDLRAPLRHIMGFAQLLEKRAGASLDEKARGYVKTMNEAAQKGGQLVDALLAFSRLGRAELKKATVALSLLVEEVRRELAPEWEGRQVTWKVEPLPTVQADTALLRAALKNLLSNALKYSRTRPETIVEVGSCEREGEVEVWVKDNGVGFEMAYVDKLFGVFQRLHTAEEFEGTGIGLANVRRVVTRHGGRVWAEGRPGEGATFHFTLPRRAS